VLTALGVSRACCRFCSGLAMLTVSSCFCFVSLVDYNNNYLWHIKYDQIVKKQIYVFASDIK